MTSRAARPLVVAALCVACAAPGGPAGAETRVRLESHTDEYYDMGQTHPAVERTSEVWFCGDKLVYITETEKIVFDGPDSSLYYVNLRDSTYAETKLPFDWARLVSGETLEFLSRYKRHGEVKNTTDTRTIEGRNCRAYDIETWIEVDDGRYSERSERVWMSKDLPINWELFQRTHRDLLVLLNYDNEFIPKLLELEGFSVLVETKTYIQGFSVNSFQRIADISDAAPPEGLCGIPNGFKQKQTLTLEDLNG